MYRKRIAIVFFLFLTVSLTGCAGHIRKTYNLIPPEQAKNCLNGVDHVCLVVNYTDAITENNLEQYFAIPEILKTLEAEFVQAGFSTEVVKTHENQAKVTADVPKGGGFVHPSVTFMEQSKAFEALAAKHPCPASVILLFDANVMKSLPELEEWKKTKDLNTMPYGRCALALMSGEKRITVSYVPPGWDPNWDDRELVGKSTLTLLTAPVILIPFGLAELEREKLERENQEILAEQIGKRFQERAIPQIRHNIRFFIRELKKFI